MKKIPIIFGLALATLLGCQRDDICPEATQTTPKLVIVFRDFENPELTKAVTDFNARAFNRSEAYFEETVNDTVAVLPLRTDQDFTDYYLTINSSLDTDANPNPNRNRDQMSFSYITQEEFVSRSCSYKTFFFDLQANRPNDTDNWIRSVEVEQPNNIIDENTTHLYIYH